MKPTFFPTPAAFREWLAANHATATELLVGFYKKASGKPSLTWPESVDEALCVGWIDGIRRNLSEDAYTIRFTPRKPRSHWSNINVARVAALTAEGRMRPAGLAAFQKRDPARTGLASYEREPAPLAAPYQKALRARARAWTFWQNQPPSYRKVATYYVMSAKKEETRERRLAALIACCAKGVRIPQLIPPGKR